MNKEKAKNQVESYGAKVIRVTYRLGKYVVSISWRDYLKVRDADLDNSIKLCLIA